MPSYKLTLAEEELVKRYQTTKDQDIAVYFFNKLGRDVLDVIYAKVYLKFSSIPLEKDDLASLVWKNLKDGLDLYKKDKQNLWSVWINNTYSDTLKEIQKYFKNSQLILNHAKSWEEYSNTHSIYKTCRNAVTFPKKDFRDLIEPVIEYVSKHTKTYYKRDIRKLLYLKSFGFSEREIAKKMNVSRRYITSMIKLVLKLSKEYLRTSNR